MIATERQDRSTDGSRRTQIYPHGNSEPQVPRGMARIFTKAGMVHFDPKKLKASEIIKASNSGGLDSLIGNEAQHFASGGTVNESEDAPWATYAPPPKGFVVDQPLPQPARRAPAFDPTQPYEAVPSSKRRSASDQLSRSSTPVDGNPFDRFDAAALGAKSIENNDPRSWGAVPVDELEDAPWAKLPSGFVTERRSRQGRRVANQSRRSSGECDGCRD
jgi:hypothetical protein